jgi:tRNA G18 (ribose-2'-O)-methylase SpoU
VGIFREGVKLKEKLDQGSEQDRVAVQFVGNPLHLIYTRMWQAMCLAVVKMGKDSPKDLVDEIVKLCLVLLDGFILPSVGIYMENFLVSFCCLFPLKVPDLLLRGLAEYRFRVANMKVLLGAAYVLVHRRLVAEPIREELVHAVLPFLNAVQHPVRARAVYCCVMWAQDKELMGALSEASKGSVVMTSRFCDACGDLSRKVYKTEDIWLSELVMGNGNLELLYFAIPCKMPEIISESFLPHVLERVLNAFALPIPAALPEVEEGYGAVQTKKRTEEFQAQLLSKDIRGDSAQESRFQLKMIPWHMLKLDESISRQAIVDSSRKLPMIVAASLLDRPPNIGGLTRTCEVFGLESIAIGDLAVMKAKDYTSVAVTAEKWIKTLHVPPDALAGWLTEMKEKGYALVGLEQTADSVSLVDFVFPRKCILVLGNELRGMPATYLSLLDHVVEIPQLGTIRSLNVHVSASICVSQYVFQQIGNDKK